MWITQQADWTKKVPVCWVQYATTKKKGTMENVSNSKKLAIKQAFFINDLFSSSVKAAKQKKNDWSKKIAWKTKLADFIIQKCCENFKFWKMR